MPTIINHDQTISALNTDYRITGRSVHKVQFIHGSDDKIMNQANNVAISLTETVGATITDHGRGMHLDIDPYTLQTTVMSLRPDAEIWMTSGTFTSLAEIAKALQVVPGFGTVLYPQIMGPHVMEFPGAYNVKLSQFHLADPTPQPSVVAGLATGT